MRVIKTSPHTQMSKASAGTSSLQNYACNIEMRTNAKASAYLTMVNPDLVPLHNDQFFVE